MGTPAGWYDDGSGRQRWWDGAQWTEHFADDSAPATPTKPGFMASAYDKATAGLASITAKPDIASIEGTLWSAVGKPLTGIGAGRYRVTEEYLIFEKGTLSSRSQQIRLREVFDVDAKQSLAQKARGVGTITLHARRPDKDEVVVLEDIVEFREGVEVINRLSDAARNRQHVRENTSRVDYSGLGGATPPGVPLVAPSALAASVDLNGEIARLAQFHAEGVLSDEEFAAGKRKLLGL